LLFKHYNLHKTQITEIQYLSVILKNKKKCCNILMIMAQITGLQNKSFTPTRKRQRGTALLDSLQ